jgi:hypothetical protein
MKPVNNGTTVMKSATDAANRTSNWSAAKKELAHKVTSTGSFSHQAVQSTKTSSNPSSVKK